METLIPIAAIIGIEIARYIPVLSREYSELYGAGSEESEHPHQKALDKLVAQMGIEIPVRASTRVGYAGASLLGRASVYVPPYGPFDALNEDLYCKWIIRDLSEIKLNNALWEMFFMIVRISVTCLPYFFLLPAFPITAALASIFSGLIVMRIEHKFLRSTILDESLKYISPKLKEETLEILEEMQAEQLAIRNDVEDLTGREQFLLNLMIDENGDTLLDRIFGWTGSDRIAKYKESKPLQQGQI